MMKKQHICITGMDGSGKSTLIKGLVKRFPSCCVANIWDLMSSEVKGLPFKSKNEIDEFLCGLTPDSRLLFLAHAMKYAVDKAYDDNTEVIFTDSYIYKYFATEKVLGANPELIKALSENFPVPDIIFELVLPLEESANRKQRFSRYECGLSKQPDEKSFINFQQKVIIEWEMFEEQNWHCVSSLNSPEETMNNVLKILNL